MDEFGLINEFARMTKTGKDVLVGIGDDTAVLKTGRKGFYELLTCDAVVEGVHFKLKDGPKKIGYKSVAVNVSDIAAMGGVPAAAVVSAGIPGKVTSKFCKELYAGILSACKKFDVELVGGDTVRSRILFISIAMTGMVEKKNLALRKGASPKDVIMVTGALGGSLKIKHLSFVPRLKEARFLVRNFRITSMMDISDGLAGDLKHLCDESGFGAKVIAGKVPVSRTLKNLQKNISLKHAFSDGEDFELLFTVPEKEAQDVEKKFNKKFRVKVSRIGKIIKKKGLFLEKEGKVSPLRFRGYSHF